MSTSHAHGSSSPYLGNCIPPSPQHQLFVNSSRNKGPKEALGPCLSELQLFPGWFLFLAGQGGHLHGKAAAGLPQNRMTLLEGQCSLRHASPWLLERDIVRHFGYLQSLRRVQRLGKGKVGENGCREEKKGSTPALFRNGASPCADAIRQEAVF